MARLWADRRAARREPRPFRHKTLAARHRQVEQDIACSHSLSADWREQLLAATATDTGLKVSSELASEQILGGHPSDRVGRHDFHGD
jgi:hypothetical protein